MKPEKKIELRNIIEGALLAAGRPLNLEELTALFPDDERPGRDDMRKALDGLKQEFEGRGIELKEVASGFRIQVRKELANYMGRPGGGGPPGGPRRLVLVVGVGWVGV